MKPRRRRACQKPFSVTFHCNAQTLLYFNVLNHEFGTSYGTAEFIDLSNHGDLVGSASEIGDTVSTTTGTASFFIEPAPPSPGGGNYVVGPANGQGNVRDFSFTLLQAVDGNGNVPVWQDGEDYEIIFWAKPSLYTETGDGEQWAYLPSSTTYQTINGPIGGPLGITFSVAGWSPLAWTEVRIPFTYDSSFDLSANNDLVAPSPDTFVQVNGSGGTAPVIFQSQTRMWQTDYGLPIPEPSTSLLLISALGFFGLRRSR